MSKCPHGKDRSLEACVECWESVMKQVSEIARQSAECGRVRVKNMNAPCEHCAEMRRCKICRGSWICKHDLNKVYCKECDGRRLCQVCFGKSMPRCYEVCRKCRDMKAAAGILLRRKFKPHI